MNDVLPLLVDKTGQIINPFDVVRVDDCDHEWIVSHVGEVPPVMQPFWKNQADLRAVYLTNPEGTEELSIAAPECVTKLYSLLEVQSE